MRSGLQAATQALARRLPARAALPGPGTPAEGARGGTTALACGEAAPPSRFAPGSERRMLSAPVALHETLNLSATEAAGVAAGAAADGVGTQETEGDAAGDAVEDLPDAVYDRLQASAFASLHQIVNRLGRMSCVSGIMHTLKVLPGPNAIPLAR